MGGKRRGTCLYRLDQSVACDDRRFQASRQSLQSAGRIHGVPDNRERHAVLAADIAKYGWTPIKTDTDGERRFAVLPTLNVPSVKGFKHHVGTDERIRCIVASRVWDAEHGEDLIADVLLDGSIAGEDLRGHPLVKLAQ
jgi:hypothetical protein